MYVNPVSSGKVLICLQSGMRIMLYFLFCPIKVSLSPPTFSHFALLFSPHPSGEGVLSKQMHCLAAGWGETIVMGLQDSTQQWISTSSGLCPMGGISSRPLAVKDTYWNQ